MMRMLRAWVIAACWLLFACACKRTPDCPTGEIPSGDVCVPIHGEDSGVVEQHDAEIDGGIVDVHDSGGRPPDSGFVDPLDGSIYDSGYVASAPVVTAGASGRTLVRGTAVLLMNN